MMVPPTVETIRSALQYIPADEYETWWRVGMALKDEFGEDGFELFSSWSATSPSYKAKETLGKWKSFGFTGPVKIGTVIDFAQQAGFDLKNYAPAVPLAKAELDRRKAERIQAEQAAAAEKSLAQDAAAELAKADWERASTSGASPYLQRKSVTGFGVRYLGADVLVPLYSSKGKLRNRQKITPDGGKFFLKKAQVSGCFHVIGLLAAAEWILVAEGYATAAALHQATGHPIVVAFNANNFRHVAKEIRALHPSAKLLFCADDDAETAQRTGKNDGIEAAIAAAKAQRGYWCKPDGLPKGKSDFNDLAAAAGADEVKRQIEVVIATVEQDQESPTTRSKKEKQDKPQEKKIKGSTKSAPNKDAASTRPFFNVNEKGVWHHGFDKYGDPLPPQWICSELRVTARSRDNANAAWGYLLEFADADGNLKRWAMPSSMLASDGAGYRSILLDMGLQIGTSLNAKTQLSNYIQREQPELRVRCTDRIGWHDGVYVLPDRTIGESDEVVMFQAPGGVVSQFKQRGSLDEWRDNVAAHCRGNSRMLFCVSAAFAAPLMHLAQVSSGGFHIWGDSSSGKSTAFKVAGSVFGGSDYPRSWHATGNALESTATQHSDALLLLDELAQVDPKAAGDTVYMLANESGKARATQTATARKVAAWRLLFLSDGEVSLASHMEQAGKGAKAGHDVRLAHIAADAGKGLGVFDTLHDFESGAALSDHLVKMSRQYYGTAGMALIEYAVQDYDSLAEALSSGIAQLVREMCPPDSHGQVSRVAMRFALVGLAGEVATTQGITGWEPGEAIAAARACFSTWLDGRGGAGNVEHVSILRQVRAFFQTHGNARFTPWVRATDSHAPVTMHRAGYRRTLNSKGKVCEDALDLQDADSLQQEYFVFTEVFRTEICKGYDHKLVAKLLIKEGMLMPGSDSATRKERLPGLGNQNCYRFTPSVFAESD